MGGCTFSQSIGDSGWPVEPLQPCKDLFPGTNCGSYQGNLILVTSYNKTSNVQGTESNFIVPDFEINLDTIGLGGVSALWSLRVYIIHLTQIPVNFTLAFQPSLTLIKDHLEVRECKRQGDYLSSCANSAPVTRRLVGLPATSNVYRVNTVNIAFTALADMMFLRGLQCPPSNVTLLANSELVTLRGLEGLGPWTKDARGPEFRFAPAPTDLSALQTMALCTQQRGTSLSGSISVRGLDSCPWLKLCIWPISTHDQAPCPDIA
jgi:hypothetical protein